MDTPANPRSATLVTALMSARPVAVDGNLEAHAAAQVARRRGVHHLLVVHQGELVGIVCLCDLENAPAFDHVDGIGRSSIVFINSSATAEAGAQVMRDSGVGCLPVIDSTGAVVGIVTRRDLRDAGLLPAERGVDLCATCGTGHHLHSRPNSEPPVFCASCLEVTPGATLGGCG
jgi:signal-transduction protein with cAMP-binding, CBS, and nucleotidyltransferase domain